MRATTFGATAALLLSLGACASHQPEPRTTAGPASTSASNAEIEALYRARQDSAKMRWTPADVAFMTGMIHHHAQAVVMSRWAPTHGASPAVQRLCARIINSQQDEIRLMQRWLRERGQQVPAVDSTGMMPMMHGDHAMHMPGMLSPEQMRQLDAARGPEFDRLFLTYMIQHHSGAITMVHELFATDGAAQDELAFKFASDVQVDQGTEIARMRKMLESLDSTGRAP